MRSHRPFALAAVLFAACAPSGFVLTDTSTDNSPAEGGGTGEGGAEPQGEAAPCQPLVEGPRINLCTAGYWGTAAADHARGIAIDSQQRIVVAAELGERPKGVDVVEGEPAGGTGALLRFGDAGRTLELVLLLNEAPSAIQADPGRKRLVLVSGNELSAWTDDSLQKVWEVDVEEPIARLDVSPLGRVAALTNTGVVTLVSPSGEVLKQFTLRSATDQNFVANDVALSGDGEVVYAVGAHSDSSGLCEGQVPFLRAFATSGELAAQAYDFATVGDNCASSAGRRVSRGEDGFIYYAGENEGGNTVHRLDPQNIETPAPLVSYDPFNQSFGKAIQRYGFVARFAPVNLEIQLGQMILPRDAEGTGGEFLIDEILGDETGQMLVLARSGCCSEARDQLLVEGRAVGAFVQPETVVLVLSPDFLTRRSWFTTTFDSNAAVEPRGMSWRNDLVALTADVPAGTSLLTHRAAQAAPLAQADGYLLSFSAPR